MREREQQLQLAWQQARDVPKGTEIIKKAGVYTFKPRDTSLEWSKGEIAKIKALKVEARKHTKRQFEDPLAGITGAVQHVGAEVAMFGFTAISSFAALGKPVAEVTLKKLGYKTKPVHYISAFDIPFEPIGWSPKGSVELLKQTGPTGWAGMAAGETLQVAAITQVLKPVTTVAKVGVKAGIKKIPSVYGKFTKVFPEEKLVSGIGKKIGATPVGRTAYRWGAKGYRKGLELTSAGVKTTSKMTAKATSELRKVSQKTIYGRGAVKKVWLSPAKFAEAEKKLAAKLASGKVVERGYWSRLRAGVGEVGELAERTKYKLTGIGRRLVKKYGYVRQTWKVGKEVSPLYKTYKIGTKKGIERYALEGAKEPIVSRGWYKAVKEMYTKGYTRVIPTETGFVLDVSKGFGAPGVRPMAKHWITRYRPPFLKNIQAQTSIALEQLKTKVSKPVLLGGRGKLITDLSTVTIPRSMYKPLYETGLEISTLPFVKTLTATKKKYELKPELMTLQRTRRSPAFKKAAISLQDVFTVPSTKMDRMLDFKLDLRTVTVPDVVQKQLYKMDVTTVARPRPSVLLTAPVLRPPLFFPRIGLGGRGRLFGDPETLLRKRYLSVSSLFLIFLRELKYEKVFKTSDTHKTRYFQAEK